VNATTDADMELATSVVIADSWMDTVVVLLPAGIAVASVLDPALYIAADALTANISSGERLTTST
jgi:hypothetical protein